MNCCFNFHPRLGLGLQKSRNGHIMYGFELPVFRLSDSNDVLHMSERLQGRLLGLVYFMCLRALQFFQAPELHLLSLFVYCNFVHLNSKSSLLYVSVFAVVVQFISPVRLYL